MSGKKEESHEMNGASGAPGAPPPSYDEALRRRYPSSPVETNLDEVEPSREEQEKLLEFYKKRKEQEDADKRLIERHAEDVSNSNDGEDEERQAQSQARLQKMVRDLRRSESGPDMNGEELEMTSRDLNRSSSFQMKLEDGDGGSSNSDYDDGANVPADKRGVGVAPTATMDEVELAFVDDVDASAAIRRSYQEALNGEPQDDHRMEQGDETEEDTKPTTICGRICKAWAGLSQNMKIFIVLFVLFFIGVVLLVSLLPASFVYVEYHEYAFSRNKITQKIDYSSVYDTGCYLLAPQDELVRFKATAHFVDQKLGVMNREGMSIKLDIMLQYFLKREELEDLYRMYYMDYEGVMESLIESTVKNTAVSFKLDDFRLQRQRVEAAIFKRLKYVLSGDCCPSCCPYNCKPDVSCRLPDCELPGRCYAGHHVDIKYFQMGEVWIPDEIMNRLLQRVILQVEAEKELYHQATAMEEKQTELEVKNISNKAKEVREKARAESRVIQVKAEADRNKVKEQAYQAALKQMFSRLNLTREDTKLSMMYIRALEDMKDNLFTFNYGVESAMTP